MAQSLISHQSLSKFDLPVSASIHLTHVSKVIQAADRILLPLVHKSGQNFCNVREKLLSTAAGRIQTEEIKKVVKMAEVFSPTLFSEETKSVMVKKASEAISYGTWKVTNSPSKKRGNSSTCEPASSAGGQANQSHPRNHGNNFKNSPI